MNKILLILTCIFLYSNLKAKEKAPFPGVVPIKGDYLFASTTEASNLNYKEFLYYLKDKGKIEEYWKNYPDTTVWENALHHATPVVKHYFRHHAYNDYPVVGLTKKQVGAYCNWLTEILSLNLPKGIKKIKVRLPTKEEWEYAARGGNKEYNLPNGINKYRMGPEDKKKTRGSYLYNFNAGWSPKNKRSTYSNDGVVITTTTISYWANDYGLYNTSGNVAEMIIDDTIAKGGSWNKPGQFCLIDADNFGHNTNHPSAEVGFRYFIEVIEYDKTSHCCPSNTFSLKGIEKQMHPINDSVFAASTECSNFQYSYFSQNREDRASKDSNWLLFNNTDYFKKYSWHIDYSMYPVVNITYENAVNFCKWLTLQYNIRVNRKYKKVVFRLPTEKEWELAAFGGDTSHYFPWGGPYLRNSRGNYLANFNPFEEQYKTMSENNRITHVYPNNDISVSRGVDGTEYMNWVYSYFPNNYGLYNCSGNAAEMIQEKGYSKGGSWGSRAYYLAIKSKVGPNPKFDHSNVYLEGMNTSPYLGFRYFMEIIER